LQIDFARTSDRTDIWTDYIGKIPRWKFKYFVSNWDPTFLRKIWNKHTNQIS